MTPHYRLFFTFSFVVAVAVAVALAGCTGDQGSGNNTGEKKSTNGQPRIVAVSYPLQSLTERLIGDSVLVDFPANNADDPSSWRPDRDQIAQMQTADLIIANGTGATYANWLTTVSLPDSKRINVASRGLSLMDFIAVEDVRMVHSHGPEGEHSHATMVSRTWLNPMIATKQADYLAGELKKKYPHLAKDIDSNLSAIKQDLDAIHKKLIAFSNEAETVEVFTATFDLKFMTQAMGVQDRHFAWDQKTSVEQVAEQLNKALQTSSKQESNGAADLKPAPKVILIPSSLHRLMGPEFDSVFETRGINRVEIDMLDLPTNEGDYFSRLESEFSKLCEAIF